MKNPETFFFVNLEFNHRKLIREILNRFIENSLPYLI